MKLSIITINYNDAAGLKKTLDSVAMQTCANFEHIIVDGASTDGSVDIICQYADSQDIRRQGNEATRQVVWLSEPDTGIYNAMNKGIEIALGKRIVNSLNRSELVEDKNKGIRMASGEYLLFLNSGDVLVDENVVYDFIASDRIEDIVAGGTLLGVDERLPKYPPEVLTYELFVTDSLMHAATFIRRELFEQYGLYNEQHRIVSDWEFFVKVLVNNNCTYTTINRLISLFDTTGISNQSSHSTLHEQERREVIDRYMPRLIPVYDELVEKRRICEEYQFLKNGRLGWVVKLCLKLKSMKQK